MDNNVIDLGDVLGTPVAASVVPPSFDQEEEIIYTVNLDPEPEPNPATSYEQIPENEDTGYMPPQDIAETIVNLLDGLQTTVVPYLREKKIFTEKELEVIQRLDTSGGTVYPENSPENKLLAKLNRHKAIVEKIPFDEGERRRLVNATARYAETTQMKVSPFQGLMMAYSEVILKRSAYFFSE